MKKLIIRLWPAGMFFIAASFYLYEFVLRVAPSAMYSNLMCDFNISASKLGLLASAYFASYSLLQAPLGAISDKFGPRRLLTFAIALCAIGALMFGVAESYHYAIIARLVIGAGSAFAFIGCMKVSTIWFKPQYFPILAGLTMTLGNLGAVTGEMPISYALHSMTWRALMYDIGVIGLILAAAAWFFVRDGRSSEKSHKHARGPVVSGDGSHLSLLQLFGEVLSKPQNWLVAGFGFLATAPTDAFGGLWGVPYLEQAHHLDHVVAAFATSMTFVGIACGSPFWGWLSNHWQNRRRVMFIGSLGAVGSLLVVIYAPHLSALTASIWFFCFGFFGAYMMCFVVGRDINNPAYVGTVVGFVNMASTLGSALLQYLIGYSLDSSWQGNMANGIPVYSAQTYHTALLILPAFYAINAFVVIPMMKESFPNALKKNKKLTTKTAAVTT